MNTENTKRNSKDDDALTPRKLDWSKAVQGKYYNRFAEGTNVAIIDPALHEQFPDSEAVNRALRAFIAIREQMEAAAPARKQRSAA